ncbi:unnamed protein product, partial [Vitis vinifera]|uniref:Uncharacterized protein n=1 Tax=Vitis vinifera TaxID=29760 RepID=D7U0X8_VITVI
MFLGTVGVETLRFGAKTSHVRSFNLEHLLTLSHERLWKLLWELTFELREICRPECFQGLHFWKLLTRSQNQNHLFFW